MGIITFVPDFSREISFSPNGNQMILKILIICLAIFYLVIAFCLFTQWLDFVEKDVSSTSRKLLTRLLLVAVTIFW